MPRNRPRAQALRAIRRNIKKRLRDPRHHRHRVDNDDETIEDMNDILFLQAEQLISSNRYLFRKLSYRDRSSTFDWEDCLSEDSVCYNTDEFRHVFRTTRDNVLLLCDLLEKNGFTTCNRGRILAPLENHILVFLYRLGSEGNAGGDSKVVDYFGIGKGTVHNYIKRVMKVVLQLKDAIVMWPDQEEREAIKRRIKVEYGFQKCVGIIDGTLVKLVNRPTKYGDSYFCRKHTYAINIQVICDDEKMIRYFYGGWPGSTHDNRSWRNSIIYKQPDRYFDGGEYLLGDSSYSSFRMMVQSFKKVSDSSNIGRHKEFFNSKLGSAHVRSEHCIGILKTDSLA